MHWNRMRVVAALFAVACPAAAQIATSASVTQAIQLQLTGAPTATLAPGLLPSSGALLAVGANLPAQVRITPFAPLQPLGGVGWEVITDLRAQTNFGATPVVASASGGLEFTLWSPQPRTGVLRLVPNSSGQANSTGDVTVDLGCDGIPDHSAATAGYLELPLVVGPAGARICIDIAMTLVVPPQPGVNVLGMVFRNWQLEFVPDVYGVEAHVPGCNGGFRWSRTPQTGALQLWLVDPNQPGPGPTIGGGFLLVGLAPSAQPLPMTPFCLQTVASPTLIPANGIGYPFALNWELPAMRLPQGLVFHAQAVWWTMSGSMFGTTSLRSF